MSTLYAVLRSERPLAAGYVFTAWVLDRLLGRLRAAVIGWPRSHIGRGAKILGTRYMVLGERAFINRDAWIEAVHNFRGQQFSPQILIGRGFSASDRLHISCIDKVQIGDDCLLGSGVYISDHNHGSYSGPGQSTPGMAPVDRELRAAGAVLIGSRVWIGDNVVIVGPLTIGSGAVIGANSVVKGDVDDDVIVAGAPARVLKAFNRASGVWEAPSAQRGL